MCVVVVMMMMMDMMMVVMMMMMMMINVIMTSKFVTMYKCHYFRSMVKTKKKKA